jgi:hypothetical protein
VGSATATAAGQVSIKLCKPNCADGGFATYKVRLAAESHARRGAVYTYKKLVITATGRRPKQVQRVQTYALTKAGPSFVCAPGTCGEAG